MAIVAVNLPVPSGEPGPGHLIVGDAIATHTMGADKSIFVDGTLGATIIGVRVSLDGVGWAPAFLFKAGNTRLQIRVAAAYMQVRVLQAPAQSDVRVSIAANDDGCLFANLPMPASGVGAGAAVAVGAFGPFKSIHAYGRYPGRVITLEASTDGIAWTPVGNTFSDRRALDFAEIRAQWIRANVQARGAEGAINGAHLAIGAGRAPEDLYESRGAKGDTGAQGIQGVPGDKGDTGAQGAKGDPGVKGDKGDIGADGQRGLQGERGVQGERGDLGLPGDRGLQGIPGERGVIGPRGEPGERGAAGVDGVPGADGQQGPRGFQGDAGPRGEQGVQGLPGDVGPRGDRGLQGNQGVKGDTGLTGARGETGADGAMGPPGDRGDQGIQGLKGDTGNVGAQGTPGTPGAKGDIGSTGAKGDTGSTGTQGLQGLQGLQGVQGPAGQISPTAAAELYEDFLSGTSGGLLGAIAVGTGAGISARSTPEAGRPGQVILATGTLITGVVGLLAQAASIQLGGGVIAYETSIQIPVLNQTLEQFTIVAGLANTVSAAPTDGVYFEYNASSTLWQRVVASTGVRAPAATTVAAVAGSWVKLRIEVNALAASAEFFINGVSVGTMTGGLPGVGRYTGIALGLRKTLGLTARTIFADYIHVKQVFTTAR